MGSFLEPLGVLHTVLTIGVEYLGTIMRSVALLDKFTLVGAVTAENEKFRWSLSHLIVEEATTSNV